MGKLKIPYGVTRFFGKTGLWFRNHTPEILLVGGTVSVLAGIVHACKQTLKLEKTVDEVKDEILAIQEDPLISEEDKHTEIVKTRIKGAATIAWSYLPSVGLIGGGFAGIYASHNIMRNRYSALAAAYSAVAGAFARYRQRVADKIGEEAEKDIRYAIEEKEVTRIDESGKEERVVEKVVNIPEYSEYARFFDESCDGWSDSAEYNLRWLRNIEQNANNRLKVRGYLFLNEVYEMLGIAPSDAGQEVGWIYDLEHPIGDNCVDFGIYTGVSKAGRRFVNGLEPVILLDFNVDGNIREGGRFLLSNSRRR